MKSKIFKIAVTVSIVTICASSSLGNAPSKLSQSPQGKTQSKHISVTKTAYEVGEKITINYFNLPGNRQDWISLVYSEEADNKYGQWIYTQGKERGQHTFNGPEDEGVYEIRIYYNWPTGSFKVEDRVTLYVLSDKKSTYFTINKSTLKANQPIVIEYHNLPGNKQDWITLVRADKPDNTYGQWFYTQGKKSGTHTFRPEASGVYELRLYYNWPDGGFEVIAREVLEIR